MSPELLDHPDYEDYEILEVDSKKVVLCGEIEKNHRYLSYLLCRENGISFMLYATSPYFPPAHEGLKTSAECEELTTDDAEIVGGGALDLFNGEKRGSHFYGAIEDKENVEIEEAFFGWFRENFGGSL